MPAELEIKIKEERKLENQRSKRERGNTYFNKVGYIGDMSAPKSIPRWASDD